MALNKKWLSASAQQIFEMLKDPYEYPNWVVGAKEIRGVDPEWPRIGSAFHHSSGVNGEVKDKTEILEIDDLRRLVLRAHLKPLGLARIEFNLRERSDGRTLLELNETPEPGTKLASVSYLLTVPLYLRNVEALRRFERALAKRIRLAS